MTAVVSQCWPPPRGPSDGFRVSAGLIGSCNNPCGDSNHHSFISDLSLYLSYGLLNPNLFFKEIKLETSKELVFRFAKQTRLMFGRGPHSVNITFPPAAN